MFNRTVEIRVVKRNDATSEVPMRPLVNPDDIAEIATCAEYWAKKAAVGFIAVYGAITAINTASQIAINAAPKR